MRPFSHSAKPISGTKHFSSANSTAQALTALRASTTLDEPILTNKLDEQQQRYVEENERARRLFQILAIDEAHSDYRFKSLSVDELLRKLAGQPLITWATGREAMTPDDISEQDALR